MKNLTINKDIYEVYYQLTNNYTCSYFDESFGLDMFEQNHHGNCIDYLNYAYTKLTNAGYIAHCYTVVINPRMFHLARSYIAVELDEKLILVETVRKDIQGIYEFDSEQELINWLITASININDRKDNTLLSVIDFTPRCIKGEGYPEFFGENHRSGRDITLDYSDFGSIDILDNHHAKYIKLLDDFEHYREKGVAVNNYANDLLDDNLICIGIKATCIICINKNTKEIVYEYATKYCNNTNWRNDLVQFAKEKKII